MSGPNAVSSLQRDRENASTEKEHTAQRAPWAFPEGAHNGSLFAGAAAEERRAELCCPLLDGTPSPRQRVWSPRASSPGDRVLIQQLMQHQTAARARMSKGNH